MRPFNGFRYCFHYIRGLHTRQRVKDIILALEIIVNSALALTRGFGNVFHCCFRQAIGLKKFSCRIEYFVAYLIVLGGIGFSHK
jgi:hypothetical protein